MKNSFERKPDWLKVRFPAGPNYKRIDRFHRKAALNSVCRSAACPNQGECWSRGTATFMILGNICTRSCTFCNVGHSSPLPVDETEPLRIAEAIAELELKHAVITTVTRDDLPDGGAAHFARLTDAIREKAPECRIELLISDLAGNTEALKTILAAGPDILGHNMETVPRLYDQVRPGASYQRSLQLISEASKLAPEIPRKSGIMVGMGEEREEILQVMTDLTEADCSLLTIGQYLAPTRKHHPVDRYVTPTEFDELKKEGEKLGFSHVESGPLVRSSYHAEQQYEDSKDDGKG